MFRPFCAAALALAVAAPLAGAPAAHAQEEAENDNPVVAIVDGIEIRRDEVIAEAQALPQQFRQVPFEMIYEPLLDRVIDSRLLAAEAERRDVADDPDVERRLDAARAAVLRDVLLEQVMEEGVTEDAIRARYEALRDDPEFRQEQVHARHILVETEEEAEALLEELEAGADFAELAIEHSTGPTGPEGGDLGYFTREEMVEPFSSAAFDLEPGEIGPFPVETEFGWHVIKVEDRRTTEPTFEEVEEELHQEVAGEVIMALLDEVREGAEIERFAPDGSPLEELEEPELEMPIEPEVD